MTRTVVVAGVGPTLGEAVAREFADRGCDLALLARSEAFVSDLAAEIEGGVGDGDAIAVTADVTDPEAVAAAFERVRTELGSPDVLVLNASVPGGGPIEECDPADFERTWRVRTFGTFLCVREALPDLRDGGGTSGRDGNGGEASGRDVNDGTVIVSGTSYAESGAPDLVDWGSAAAATRGLCRSLAPSLAPEGVHVVYVAIGAAVAPADSAWDGACNAGDVAETYWHLVEQDRSAWTHELSLAPAMQVGADAEGP